MIDVGGGSLWTWDSGGRGEAIMLLHPATGSAAIWDYQYRPFVEAGYRVIAYSRRGHYRSPAPAADPGFSADDLHRVAEALALARFHLVGCAAGGFIAPDYALLHPERLLSIVLACTQGGGTDPHYRQTISRILPAGFAAMPASFRELGPSYRAANPEGVSRWEMLEHIATPNGRLRQRARNNLDWPTLARIATPTLVLAGGADLYIPPSLARIYAGHIPGSRFAIIPESGHSAYWEQPNQFNTAVLGFLAARRR
jgi:pimeloyl-ACP methyl ester carboxylesterase